MNNMLLKPTQVQNSAVTNNVNLIVIIIILGNHGVIIIEIVIMPL